MDQAKESVECKTVTTRKTKETGTETKEDTKDLTKEEYELIIVLNAGQVVLGSKHGFGKDADLYTKLEENLEKDWLARNAISLNDELKVGEHVLVNKLGALKGFKRGIIQGLIPLSFEHVYLVYLYDEGLSIEVTANCIIKLGVTRKEELKPRTVFLQLCNIVPSAKRSKGDSKKKPASTEKAISINFRLYSVHLPRKSKKLTENWLLSAKQLHIKVSKTRKDLFGTVLGDIIRTTVDGSRESLVAMLQNTKRAQEMKTKVNVEAAQMKVKRKRCNEEDSATETAKAEVVGDGI